MKHLEINGIKNKTNDISFMYLSKADRDYIANFMYDHKEEFRKKHFEIFCNSEFLQEVREYNVDLFIKMLLDISEYYTIDFLNALLDFSPFTKRYYVCLRYNTKGNFLKYESIRKIKALLKKNESTVREIKIK